ncbi:MAG: winged helix-turn-helix transcriptional regulator [Selenomonadales bacterium]|nr:winged helix-turn-helix transcriptional regulator [Selenomonadales bacterium]
MKQEIAKFEADFFKALGHPLRIRILAVLAQGERTVNEIQTLTESEGSAVSQQLAVLRSKNIVYGTKNGTRVIYSLRDPMIKDLLMTAKSIFQNHLIDSIAMLDHVSKEDRYE